jgi:hypothetical protein
MRTHTLKLTETDKGDAPPKKTTWEYDPPVWEYDPPVWDDLIPFPYSPPDWTIETLYNDDRTETETGQTPKENRGKTDTECIILAD